MEKFDMSSLIQPMLAKPGYMPEDFGNYYFEIKWDGFRAITYLDNGSIRLFSRNLKDLSPLFPEISLLAAKSKNLRLILDGEIVSFDSQGKPSFNQIQHRSGLGTQHLIERKSKEFPVSYQIFDILFHDDTLLIDKPYSDRREILDSLGLNGPHWGTPPAKLGLGPELLSFTKSFGLEGVIAKQANSLYHPGKRSDLWLKIKNQHRQEFVIAGWTPGKGIRKNNVGSLLVGYYPNKSLPEAKLIFAGKVGSGFSDYFLAKASEIFPSLSSDVCPFSEIPPVKDAVFLKPVLVGEFDFLEWTPNNTLRHPSFKGLRLDKTAYEVHRD